MELNALQAAYMRNCSPPTRQTGASSRRIPHVFQAPHRLRRGSSVLGGRRRATDHLLPQQRRRSPKDFVDLGKALFRFFDDPELRLCISTGVGYLENEAIIAPQADMPYFYHPVEPEFRLRLLRRFKGALPQRRRY